MPAVFEKECSRIPCAVNSRGSVTSTQKSNQIRKSSTIIYYFSVWRLGIADEAQSSPALSSRQSFGGKT